MHRYCSNTSPKQHKWSLNCTSCDCKRSLGHHQRCKVKDIAFYPQSLFSCPPKCNCTAFNALACSQGFFSWQHNKIKLQEEEQSVNTDVPYGLFLLFLVYFWPPDVFFLLTFFMKTRKSVHFIRQLSELSFLHSQNYRVLSEHHLFCLKASTSQREYTWLFLFSLVMASVR